MKRAGRYAASVIIVSGLTVASVLGFTLWNLRPLLGLDLVGGVSVVLTAPEGTDPDVVDRTMETIRDRVDAFGVAEPDITRQGDLNIEVQIPEVESGEEGDRQQRLLDLIGRTAQLQFRMVEELIVPGTPGYEEAEDEVVRGEIPPDEEVVLAGTDGSLEPGEDAPPTLYRLGPVQMTGDRLTRAEAVIDPASPAGRAWQVSFDLDGEGARQFATITRENVGIQMAIVLDERVESAPTIQDEIPGGSGVITGDFTEEEARDLATVLRTGALPVRLEASQVLTVSPTLGAESLRQGLAAAGAGLIALALYLFFYYRLLGIVTWVGMLVWGVLALALVSLAGESIGYSLTLAGVAGLVVALGIGADSYIVFFERLKDEIRQGKTLRAAMVPAFQRAWRTIVAADIVTISAAIILYLVAIGSVRGFALTLGVATALDLFVVYFFKRPAVYLLARSSRIAEIRGLGLRSGVAMDPKPAPVEGGSE